MLVGRLPTVRIVGSYRTGGARIEVLQLGINNPSVCPKRVQENFCRAVVRLSRAVRV